MYINFHDRMAFKCVLQQIWVIYDNLKLFWLDDIVMAWREAVLGPEGTETVKSFFPRPQALVFESLQPFQDSQTTYDIPTVRPFYPGQNWLCTGEENRRKS
jgi:hypothetical protein